MNNDGSINIKTNIETFHTYAFTYAITHIHI